MVTKLWDLPGPSKRVPVRIKRHSRFVGGRTLTIVGSRWCRTWGILPKGEEMCVGVPYTWTGGMSWKVRNKRQDRYALTRPTIALCKWRYR